MLLGRITNLITSPDGLDIFTNNNKYSKVKLLLLVKRVCSYMVTNVATYIGNSVGANTDSYIGVDLGSHPGSDLGSDNGEILLFGIFPPASGTITTCI